MTSVLNKLSIDDIDVKGKKVLVRCDFNVPIVNGVISDDTRIIAALPTIQKLIEEKAQVILCSHIGKREKHISLFPVAKMLSVLLSKNVKFIQSETVVDDEVKNMVRSMKNGDVCLLENTRFREEEEQCKDNFSMELAALTDGIFVDDAFGSAHRAHASNVGVTKYIDTCVSGYLMQKEIDRLVNAIENPERPFVAILGGAKISDKLKVIDKLLDKCEKLIIGGGMSFTFLKAQGKNVGKSLVDEEKLSYCKEMLEKAESLNKQLILPIDCIATKDFPNPINNMKIETKSFNIEDLTDEYMGLDIGSETIKLFMKELKNAKTVIWNGPMGVFENQNLAIGTYCIARYLSEMKYATTIIGGGDSASAVKKFNLADKMTHVSTGGGATLEYLEGIELPGILSLTDK